jgi:hypothetical protein
MSSSYTCKCGHVLNVHATFDMENGWWNHGHGPCQMAGCKCKEVCAVEEEPDASECQSSPRTNPPVR